MIDFRRMGLDLLALGLLAATGFLALSLVSFSPTDPPGDAVFPAPARVQNLCGPAGAVTAHLLLSSVGLAAWYVVLAIGIVDLRLFARSGQCDVLCRGLGWGLTIAALCGLCGLLAPAAGSATILGSGGHVGAVAAMLLVRYFSVSGGTILLATGLAAGVILSGDLNLLGRTLGMTVTVALWPFRMAWQTLKLAVWILTLPLRPVLWLMRRRPVQAAAEATAAPECTAVVAESEGDCTADEDDEPATLKLTFAAAPPVEADAEAAKSPPELPVRTFGIVAADDDTADAVDETPAVLSLREPVRVNAPAVPVRQADAVLPHDLPDLDLLEEAEPFPFDLLAAKARAAADVLEQTFKEFGLNVTVSEIDTGPVVTQFELNLQKGLRVSKVAALADDLAIALRVPAVRVVSPIPGKNTVGVEVPNEKQVMVRLRELIETCPTDKLRVPLFLGKDVAGRPLAVDLTKMPHLLIAGRTGTGKSVCLNTLIMSILITRSPDDVRMLMIDPKMVELSPYKRIPHLMHPVITDMKKAEAVLGWAVEKMEERYALLARCGVRHLDSYNKLSRAERLERMELSELHEEAEAIPDKMPYIIIIADEMADMMMTSGKDVEAHIIRLAQKSRAVGIHLVLATQKPTVDVITGLIKSNLPARISFQVSSRTDSRVVLDENGAERLLGNGDMLYLAPGTSSLTRAQGTYVSGEEVDSVIEFFSDCEPNFSEELANLEAAGSGTGKAASPGGNRDRDELYDRAVEVVVNEGRGSTSLLQRALGIGYGRAARLIDFMAEDGIVGEYNGSQAREVLIGREAIAS